MKQEERRKWWKKKTSVWTVGTGSREQVLCVVSKSLESNNGGAERRAGKQGGVGSCRRELRDCLSSAIKKIVSSSIACQKNS